MPTPALPALFVSHGAPTLPIDPAMPHEAWARLGHDLPRPRAILVASAHWETVGLQVSTSERPETVHDFRGFPPALYQIRYPAPGAPDVAHDALDLLNAAGLPAQGVPHGLDHGAWVPLLMLFPDASIPVAQIAIQPHQDPAHHWKVGQALRALREDGVLVVGSGQITHNLYEADFRASPQQADPRVNAFTGWVEARLAAGDHDALLDYRAQAPHAVAMHPTDEHLLPLFVALGAAAPHARVEVRAMGTFQRSLAMTHYLFHDAPVARS